MFVFLGICVYTHHVYAGTCGGQHTESLGLELQVVVGHYVDAGTEPRSSLRAASALNP